MATFRVIRVPLVFVGLAVVLMLVDLTQGVIWFGIMVALTVAKWAEWRFWPRLRFRVWPRKFKRS